MDLEEIGINVGNWVDSAQDRNSPCECGIEPPGSISHGVNIFVQYEFKQFNVISTAIFQVYSILILLNQIYYLSIR